MARIAGIDLPRDKRVEIALTYIFGIGLTRSRKILEVAEVSPDTRVRDLTEGEIARLRDVIEREYQVEGDLRRQISMNIRRLVEIGSYRGLRHRRGLPAAEPDPRRPPGLQPARGAAPRRRGGGAGAWLFAGLWRTLTRVLRHEARPRAQDAGADRRRDEGPRR